jgi:UPF0755 protein
MSAARSALRLALLLVLLVVVAAAALYYRLEHPPRPATPSQAVIVFAQGTPTAEIFRKLAQEGVVRDARLAELYYRLYRRRTPLQAGEYRFDRPMPIDDIINRMGRGEVLKYSVVVPDGLTAEETFELFWKRGIGGPEAFHKAFRETSLLPGLTSGVSDLEGFLFPETYVVTHATPARAIVEMMVAQFQRNFTPETREKGERLGLTVLQTVTLASIVEKESGLSREGPTIASVYLNRLKRGMRLQADPTVIYALKRDGQWTGTLHRSDYAHESPYNTYASDGLPPGPICNPGLTALKAAVAPARTDYLYFVADESGGHRFSRTFEEHLAAIAAARRARAENDASQD